MRPPVFIGAALLLFVVSTSAIAAAPSSCAEKQAHLLTVLRNVIGAVRQRLTEVKGEASLSEESKGAFRQDAEWLAAWVEDAAQRMEGVENCGELSHIASDALAQILPVERSSRMLQATVLLWDTDRLLENVRRVGSGMDFPEIQEARSLFHTLASEPSSALESRPVFRRGIFLIRQTLRKLRIGGILS